MTPDMDEVMDPVWKTPFGAALRWRVHNPDEALSIAAWHRAQAANALRGIPVETSDSRDMSRALDLGRRARRHDELRDVCERHAENLRCRSRSAV